jgi:transcriptional regulator with XRE-family HTH domain
MEEDLKKEIGERIAQKRVAKGLSQSELGKLCYDLTQGAISQYENGTIKNIELKKLIKIAETLNTSTDYLLLGKKIISNTNVEKDAIIDRLEKEIASLNKRIAKLEEESELRLSLIRAYELQIQGLKDNINELKKIG